MVKENELCHVARWPAAVAAETQLLKSNDDSSILKLETINAPGKKAFVAIRHVVI